MLINREAVGQFKKCSRLKDLRLLGDLVDSIDILVEKLGWKNDLDELMRYELMKNVSPCEEDKSSMSSFLYACFVNRIQLKLMHDE